MNINLKFKRKKKILFSKLPFTEFTKLKKFLNIRVRILIKNFEKYLKYKKKNNYASLLVFFFYRLDFCLYFSKIVSSLKEARQFISHGLVYVNNKKVDLSHVLLKVGDVYKITKPTSVIREKKYAIYKECAPWIKQIFSNNIVMECKLVRSLSKSDVDNILNIKEFLIFNYISKKYGVK